MNIDEVLEVAQNVRNEIVLYYGDTEGTCRDASQSLIRDLGKIRITAKIVFGEFIIDASHLKATHFWVELDDKILDVTADQFNPYVYENIPKIIFSSYEDQPRYIPVGKWGM